MAVSSKAMCLSLCALFACFAMLVGLFAIFSPVPSNTALYDTEKVAVKGDNSLPGILSAMHYDPYEAKLWVRLAHSIKNAGPENSPAGADAEANTAAIEAVDEALAIAEALSPALKYDLARHRLYLLKNGSGE